MNVRRTFTRLLALWLVTSVLIAIYAWLNVILIATRPRVDIAFGILVILGLTFWAAQPAIWLTKKRVSLWVCWGFSALAALTGILWSARLSDRGDTDRFPLSLLSSVPRLIDIAAIKPVLQLRESYRVGAELTPVTMMQLGLACLALGMLALVTAISLHVVWMSLQSVLGRQLDKLHARLPRLPIRPGRWLARLRRLLLAGFVLSLVVSGLAVVANARIPQHDWRATASGPDVILVQSLLLDERDGTLYAGILGGLFRSTDGGTNWQLVSRLAANSSVSALLLDDRDGTLYAGTWGEGVFRSTDAGMSWQESSNGEMSDTDVNVLVLDERDGTLYAGTDGGVFRSTDSGMSWQAVNNGLSGTYVNALVLDERDGTLYAGTDGGVLRSTDGGTSWQAVSSGLTNTGVSALALDERDGTLYAGTGDGVFRSTDGGASWQAISNDLTNDAVLALALDERDGTLYAGTWWGGVFRSTDGGTSWQAVSGGLTNTIVWALVLDERDGTLYAGTWGGGVFRSTDGEMNWQDSSNGLMSTQVWVWALMLDEQTETLYAGTKGSGVFYSTDHGASWKVADNNGLSSTDVYALTMDEQNETLYAGTGEGVFRSSDGGDHWQALNNGLFNTDIYALIRDERDGTLYAGTGEGVFRSSDGGGHWQVINNSLSNTDVYALILEERDGTLYAGTDEGVFRSTDGGTGWQSLNNGLTNTVLALALDQRDGTLYAGTEGEEAFYSTNGGVSWQAVSNEQGGINGQIVLALHVQGDTLYAGTSAGVFRSDDNGVNWQQANTGLKDANVFNNVSAMMLDEQDSTLYAGTWTGVFYSNDGGINWHGASAGLGADVQALALDRRNDTLYADTFSGMFLSTDGGEKWEKTSTDHLRDFLSIWRDYGGVARGPEGSTVWAVCGGGAFWARLVAKLGLHQAAIWPQSNGKARILTAFGSTLSQTELDSGYQRIPLAWLTLRALVWKATTWTIDNSRWLGATLALTVTLVIAFTYANFARPFGLPLWATFLARGHLDAYANPAALENAWPDWERAIRTELLQHGDTTADDLLRVPGPFRRYALQRYDQEYDSIQTLEAYPGRLRLLTGDRLDRWHTAWATTARSLGTRAGITAAGRKAVDDLADVLADALGLTLGQSRDFEATRAFLVEAPALRLKLPPRFPLVFVADPQPDARTVQMLVDTVDVLRETGYFALVVPLEPRVRQLDIAAEMRQVVDRSPHVQDFIILSQDDVLDIIVARHPAQSLVQCILAQMDLTVVSPFVVSGPVPETMFFGREAEVKTLVESASSTDFAIVGNRKIGKTSLLRRARARMIAGKRVKPLMVDCQTVRNATGFFAAFQSQTGLALSSPTPEGLTAALTELRQAGLPVVLLMDEVDALLADEKDRGEPLVATWRALAQADVCHFVLCSSTGLARRLDDPDSALFNFPQPLPLGYLSPDTARMVLSQPLETLGIVIEDAEILQDEALVLTSGHPNLTQYLGQKLVEAANRRGERRILLEDLTSLRNSTDFVEYYLKTVWGQAGPLEKLITLTAAPGGFQLGEMETSLAAYDLQVREEELDIALKMLRIYSILEKHERTYTFVPQAFPEILHCTQEVDRLIAIEKRRLITGGV
jgi:ligand-binding sensor domain-containing protein